MPSEGGDCEERQDRGGETEGSAIDAPISMSICVAGEIRLQSS